MNRKLALLVVLASIAFVPVVAAATPISGTVTTENGSADGASVTVVPVSENLQRVDDPVTTTVDGSSFSVDAADAPLYAIRVEYGGATHYEVLRNETHAEFDLTGRVSGRVVDEADAPRANATVELVDGDGFVVDTGRTGANGTFAFAPVEADETYRVRAVVGGVPYRESVNASANGSVTVSTPPPTNDSSVLAVAGDSRTSHVLQVVAPQNESGRPSVVETVTLRNTADRPYLGTVELRVPTDATPYAAMVDNRGANYQRTERGIRVNATVPANGTTQVGVAYDLAGPRFEKRFDRNASRVAVVLRGYDPARVDHSENLRVGDAPVALLTTDGPIREGETIRVTLSDARSDPATDASVQTGASESSSIPEFPAVPIFGGLAAMVGGGLVAYRVAP